MFEASGWFWSEHHCLHGVGFLAGVAIGREAVTRCGGGTVCVGWWKEDDSTRPCLDS
jgi:hypothetical protein